MPTHARDAYLSACFSSPVPIIGRAIQFARPASEFALELAASLAATCCWAALENNCSEASGKRRRKTSGPLALPFAGGELANGRRKWPADTCRWRHNGQYDLMMAANKVASSSSSAPPRTAPERAVAPTSAHVVNCNLLVPVADPLAALPA